ncbi:hypothetical protein [Fulvimarina sp. MAC8]|uniref:hypothetical protein n=1 Tax=Fulvimarina sp. MAC8 TaxID=3162874 RepID=UPI0032EE225A
MTSPIEKSIRRALEAGASDSPKFRQGVYRAAGRAIERVLATDNDEARAEAKRRELKDAVERVEAEYSDNADPDEPAVRETPAPPPEESLRDEPAPAPSEPEPAPEHPVEAPPVEATADIDPAFVPQPETRKTGDIETPPIVEPEREPEERPDDDEASIAPEAPGARDEAPIVPPPATDEPIADSPRAETTPEPAARRPRAFAPPPSDGREDTFEGNLDLGGVTPTRAPAVSDSTGGSAGFLGALSRREDGIAGRNREATNDRPTDFDNWRPGSKHPRVKRRSKAGGFLVSAIIVLLFAFLIVAGAYLLAPFLMTAASNDAPRSAAEGEDMADTARDTQDWITVFSGREIGQINTPNGGRVTTEEAPDGSPTVRISGPVDEGGGEIGFVVGPGVVSQLGGSDVRAELTVGSAGGDERSFAVRCLFEGETRCGRQRFTTSLVREPFVFAVDLSGVDEDGGEIAIDPAIGGSNDLLVYELRLTANGGS